jgi:hypothetical protein
MINRDLRHFLSKDDPQMQLVPFPFDCIPSTNKKLGQCIPEKNKVDSRNSLANVFLPGKELPLDQTYMHILLGTVADV